jgi:hypothetical protein
MPHSSTGNRNTGLSQSDQQQHLQNYARQLDDHEGQFAALRAKQAELRRQKTALDAALAGMIEALTF